MVTRLTFAFSPSDLYNEDKRTGMCVMKAKDDFFKTMCALAVPVALQSMLQSSFSMVDQIMIG